MRKIILALSAVAALAVAAQPAAADAPHTSDLKVFDHGRVATCTTGWQYGVFGEGGAWGNYIDGCTVMAFCPAGEEVEGCSVISEGAIETQEQHGHQVTLNARQRWNGDSNLADRSCDGADSCKITVNNYPNIKPGQWGSTQCNGVRDNDIPDSDQTLARVTCKVMVIGVQVLPHL